MKHAFVVHTNCSIRNCPICEGGLHLCSVCGGAESSLTTDCPDKKIPGWLETAVSNAYMDFVGGKWVITERGKNASKNCVDGAHNLNTLAAMQEI